MLKKAVTKKQLALAAQTIRNLNVVELIQVNGGQQQAVEVSVQSAAPDACSSTH
jgi:hypothetical protein